MTKMGIRLASVRGAPLGGERYCGEPGCNLPRRLWRRIWWWNGAIGLQGLRYCAPQCFEQALQTSFLRASRTGAAQQPVQHRIPLGLLMLSRGQLTNQQLRSALDAQRESGRYRLGEWLERLGFATEQQVTAALGAQWSCPVLTTRVQLDPDCVRLLPYRLLEQFRMLPLQFVSRTRTFYLAFSDGIDYRALHAIEQILECHTDPCLIGPSQWEEAMEAVVRDRGLGDFLFEGWRDASEMARITCSYVLKLGADDVRVAGFEGYIWARLAAGRDFINLLFRRDAGTGEAALADRAPQPLRVVG